MQDLEMYNVSFHESVKFPLNTREAMILLCAVVLFSYLFTSRSLDSDKNQKDLLQKIDEMNQRNKAIEEGLLVVIGASNTSINSINLLEDSIRHLCTNHERTTDLYGNLLTICNDVNKKLRINGIVLRRTV